MSPILTRPVREQLEHDRIIRLLQARYRRKFEVDINVGGEQNSSITAGDLTLFPDLVLYSQERGRTLMGTVEVETGESVNSLEAMSQWAPFSRQKAPFTLYVPPNSLDTARRLCAEHHIVVSELWTYHTALDQVRFTLVDKAPEPVASRSRSEKSEPAVVDEAPTVAPPAPARAAKRAKPAPVKVAAKAPKPPAKSAKAVKVAKKTAPPAKRVAKRAGSSAKPSPVARRAQPASRPARGAAKAAAPPRAGATKRR